MRRPIWLVASLVLGILTIMSEVGIVPPLVGAICGPLVIAGIIGWIYPYAWRQEAFGRLIIGALAVSMCADIVISRSFLAGLIIFLIAHLIYLIAFIPKTSWKAYIIPGLLYGAAAVGIASGLLAGASAKGLLIPVVIYMVCVTFMATTLSAAFIRQKGIFVRAAIGGGLFFISDGIIGIKEFAGGFTYAGVAILITYWSAQVLIASVLVKRAKF